ncbi:epoxide hydrolase family protein [Aureimonas sp. AU12]|uniref:epoxide hydrolase family protein n=1 Tax=Aureimonas sp. AU12 TaxID=1638161 RepID=UPI0007844A4A|nr:epoxide hydrolase family protein [Aureimonas sp. AU12]
MTPFEVSWDEAKLEAVRDRVRAFRMPVTPQVLDGEGWRYGCDPAFLETLRQYWLDGFDARAAERELNRFPQVTLRVEGLDLHAVHLVGEAEGRNPLLLTHGWPGSTYEFWQVAEPLAFPSRFGGRAEDAFDLVIPSLPGFGFSGKPSRPIGPRTVARLFDTMMREGFGYSRYLAQGGDWGAGVSALLALDHPASVKGIHLNYLLVQPAGDPETAEEKAWKSAYDDAQQRLGGYSHLQGTKPQSLAYAMADNPMAQAAWLVERFHDWADLRGKPFEEVFTLDQLLTDVMITVMNDAFPTAAWIYAGAAEEGIRKMAAGQRVDVPTAFSAYPDPRAPNPPRSWVERGYRLTRWRDMPRGGHFAAMEAPDLFVEDLRDWSRSLA